MSPDVCGPAVVGADVRWGTGPVMCSAVSCGRGGDQAHGAISLLWVVLAVLSFPLGTENHSGNCSHVNPGWVGQISVLSD